jgi:hypothetical protein
MNAAWTGLISPPFEIAATRSSMSHDSQHLEHCSQACPLPTSNVTNAMLLHSNCPFHSKLLQIPVSRSIQVAAQPLEAVNYTMLVDMPPLGLTSRCRLGTSASCGCSCTATVRDSVSREIDRITLELRTNMRNGTNN